MNEQQSPKLLLKEDLLSTIHNNMQVDTPNISQVKSLCIELYSGTLL